MSALGPEQTSRNVHVMSVLPPKADIFSVKIDVCFVPKADLSVFPSPCPKPRWNTRAAAVSKINHSIVVPMRLAKATLRDEWRDCPLLDRCEVWWWFPCSGT